MANSLKQHLQTIFMDAYSEGTKENRPIREDSAIIGGETLECAINGTQVPSLQDLDSARVIDDIDSYNKKRTYVATDLASAENTTNYTATDVTEQVLSNHCQYLTDKVEVNNALLTAKDGAAESLVDNLAKVLRSSLVKKSDSLITRNFPIGKTESRLGVVNAGGDVLTEAAVGSAEFTLGSGTKTRNQKRIWAVTPAVQGVERGKSIVFDNPAIMAKGVFANIVIDENGNKSFATGAQAFNWGQILEAQAILSDVPGNPYMTDELVVLTSTSNAHSLYSTTKFAIHADFRDGRGLREAMNFQANMANYVAGVTLVPLRNVTFPVLTVGKGDAEAGSSASTATDYNTSIITYKRNLCPTKPVDTTYTDDSLTPKFYDKGEDAVMIARVDSMQGFGIKDARHMVTVFHK